MKCTVHKKHINIFVGLEPQKDFCQDPVEILSVIKVVSVWPVDSF